MTTACLTDRSHRPRRVPDLARADRGQGFFSLLDTRWERHLATSALSCLEEGVWRRLSYGEVQLRTTRLAAKIRERGHGTGEHMAILAEPSPEWGIAFLAILRSGGVAVPLDAKLEEEELVAILEDARPGVLFVSPDQLPRAQALEERVASIWEIVVLEADRVGGVASPEDNSSPRARGDRSPDEVALITYTSGTTGKPKGVMTTFGSLIHQATSLGRVHPFEQRGAERDRMLSILPLNHMFELVGGFLTVLWNGGEICYGNSHFPDDVLRALRDRRITRMLCVPLFLDLIKRRMEKRIAERPLRERLAFRFAFHVAGRVHSLRAKRWIFRKVHAALGGSLQYFVSGGAPLEPGTERFFERIGLPVYQGYGLTETSPVVAVNTPQHWRVGSVGRPLPGVDVAIQKRHVDDLVGEILTRGPQVMEGYRGRPDLTAAAIDADGWFHTGDLGHLDADGFLFVTGRAKSLVVLGTGKKVQPEEVEACLAKSPVIGEVCVIGIKATEGLARNHEKVCAVVVPAGKHSEEETVREVQRWARALATYKRPSTVVVRNTSLPRTSTAKVRRDEVKSWVDEQRRLAS